MSHSRVQGGRPVSVGRAATLGDRLTKHKWHLTGLLLLVMVMVGYPMYLIASMSLTQRDPEGSLGLDNFIRAWDHKEWIWNSLYVCLAATVLALVLGSVLAFILFRTDIPRPELFNILVQLPFPMGPLVAAFAWSVLGAPNGGLINRIWRTLTGSEAPLMDVYTPFWMIVIMALVEAPVAVLMIGAAMRRMDPSLEECSRVMGSSTLSVFRKITVPLMAPAILGAGIFLFAMTMGSFAIPAVLGGNARFYVTTTAIYQLFNTYPSDYGLAAALGAVLIAATAIVVWGVGRYLKGRSYVVVSGKAFRPRVIAMKRWRPVVTVCLAVYVFITGILPIGVLAVASLQRTSQFILASDHWTLANFHYVLVEYPTTRNAIFNSIIVGVATAIIATALATMVARLTTRNTGMRVAWLEQLTMIPQSVPRLIFAVGLLWMVLALPFRVYGTLTAVVIGFTIVFLPLAYQSMRGVVVQIDGSLEEAARVTGARTSRVLRTITGPLLVPGMTSAFILVFMTSIREVSTAIFLTGPGTEVLGPAIFNFWDSGGVGKTSALVMVQTAIIVVAMAATANLGRLRKAKP